MFAFSFFEGSHICRFLPILRPSTVPRSHFSYPKTKAFTLIISHLYLQVVTSVSESRLCVGRWNTINGHHSTLLDMTKSLIFKQFHARHIISVNR